MVIDDFLGKKRGGFFNYIVKLSNESQEKNEMKKYVHIYRKLEEIYTAKSKDPKKYGGKVHEYEARAEVCRLAHTVLRNASSSSVMERDFSSACRSIIDKRFQLRIVFKIPYHLLSVYSSF